MSQAEILIYTLQPGSYAGASKWNFKFNFEFAMNSINGWFMSSIIEVVAVFVLNFISSPDYNSSHSGPPGLTMSSNENLL